jgi:hypothetical protein
MVLLSLCSWEQAQASAGEVTAARGRVTVATPGGEIKTLRRGSAVEEGDVVNTGPGSYAKMKFSDGSAFYLRPSTRFQVESYQDTGGKKADDRSIFGLLKGGFRFVSGLIGKRNRDAVRLRTPVATIGIRGSDGTFRLCSGGDCFDVPLDEIPEDGLYMKTNEGEFFIQQEEDGRFVVTPVPAGKTARVKGKGKKPEVSDEGEPVLENDDYPDPEDPDDEPEPVGCETGS